jgi:hypothetical protein
MSPHPKNIKRLVKESCLSGVVNGSRESIRLRCERRDGKDNNNDDVGSHDHVCQEVLVLRLKNLVI